MERSAFRYQEQTVRGRLLRELVRLSFRLRRDLDKFFARYGISGAQWGAMRSLHRAESERRSGLSLRELGERMLVRPPSMTNVIERLERAGYVRKRLSRDDRRTKQVSLTPQGRQLVETILRGRPNRIQQIVGELDDRDASILLELVDRLSKRLEEPVHPGEEHGA